MGRGGIRVFFFFVKSDRRSGKRIVVGSYLKFFVFFVFLSFSAIVFGIVLVLFIRAFCLRLGLFIRGTRGTFGFSFRTSHRGFSRGGRDGHVVLDFLGLARLLAIDLGYFFRG